jgi:putative N-acetyltransferase (TIGR04045 family)
MPRPEILCRRVTGPDDEALHHRIRHEVFVLEQEVFAASDVDAHDADLATIKVLAWAGGEPGGAVRLYRVEPEVWQGDRLAVLPAFRAWNVGGPLVRFAVETAASLGGAEMVAHVQVANVRFFERLGWRSTGEPEVYVGLPHQVMAIDLSRARGAHRPAAGRSPARS